MNILATKIKQKRIEAKLTQAELALKLNIGNTTISNYESGYSTPDLDMIAKIAETLHVPVSYFVDKEPNDLSVEANFKNLIDNLPIEQASEAKEFWELIKQLDIKEIEALKDIKKSGLSLVEVNNALKILREQKK